LLPHEPGGQNVKIHWPEMDIPAPKAIAVKVRRASIGAGAEVPGSEMEPVFPNKPISAIVSPTAPVSLDAVSDQLNVTLPFPSSLWLSIAL